MIEGGQRAGFAEFVALMATLMSLVALSIDAMLPALGEMGRELGAGHSNSVQLVVSVMFLGMAAGQLFYGPLSDSVGRKPALLAGLALYAAGCLVCLFSRSFPVMLAGRLAQGLGAAGPRIVSIALIRDRYDGRRMARVMSLVMAIFIAVPILAPALGQGILLVAGWRAIFGVFLAIAAVASVWFTLRQDETLAPGRRIPFTLSRIVGGLREVLGSRTAVGYATTAGLVLGASVGYLSTAQQVFQEQYRLGRLFPLYFALLATALGTASLLNAHLVTRFGMRPLARGALLAVAGLSVTFFAIAYAELRASAAVGTGGVPVRGVPVPGNPVRQPDRPRHEAARPRRRHGCRGRRGAVDAHLGGGRDRDRTSLRRHGPPPGGRLRRPRARSPRGDVPDGAGGPTRLAVAARAFARCASGAVPGL